MRFLLPLALLCFFWSPLASLLSKNACTSVRAQVKFIEGESFQSVLDRATDENKLVFIDAYTTWCGPCKMMDRKVFSDAAVGEAFNARFINAKFDMEAGEGPAIAQRYGVQAYPTYLFVNGAGEIVHRGVGYIPQARLLALADVAESDESLGALNARYDAGERDPAFVSGYIATLNEMMDQQRAKSVITDYLATQEDWSDESTLGMLVVSPGEVGSKTWNYLLDNAEGAIAAAGSQEYVMALQKVLITRQMRASGQRELPSVEAMNDVYRKDAAAQAPRLNAHYAMFHAQQMRDVDNYLPAAIAYLTAYPSTDFSELNSIAWDIYEQSDDPAQLAAGLKFAQQSVALNAYYPNLDTLAWLYKKTGDDKMAKETALRAIEMAKAEDLDYSDTEKILEE